MEPIQIETASQPSHKCNPKHSMGANLGVLHVCSISNDTMRQRKKREKPKAGAHNGCEVHSEQRRA